MPSIEIEITTINKMTSVEILQTLVQMINAEPNFKDWDPFAYKKYIDLVSHYLQEVYKYDPIETAEFGLFCVSKLSVDDCRLLRDFARNYDGYLYDNDLFNYKTEQRAVQFKINEMWQALDTIVVKADKANAKLEEPSLVAGGDAPSVDAHENSPLSLKNFFAQLKEIVLEKNISNGLEGSPQLFKAFQLVKRFNSFAVYLSRLSHDNLVNLMKDEIGSATDTDFIDFLQSLHQALLILQKANMKTHLANVITPLCCACLKSIKNKTINNAVEQAFFEKGGIYQEESATQKLNFYRSNDNNSYIEYELDEMISSLAKGNKDYRENLSQKPYGEQVLKNKLGVAAKLENAIDTHGDIRLLSNERIQKKRTKITNYHSLINDKKNIEILTSHRCHAGKIFLRCVATVFAAPVWWISRDKAYGIFDKIWNTKGDEFLQSQKNLQNAKTSRFFIEPPYLTRLSHGTTPPLYSNNSR